MNISTYLTFGYPRSGTTWFTNLFDFHPDIVSGIEKHTFDIFDKLLKFSNH